MSKRRDTFEVYKNHVLKDIKSCRGLVWELTYTGLYDLELTKGYVDGSPPAQVADQIVDAFNEDQKGNT